MAAKFPEVIHPLKTFSGRFSGSIELWESIVAILVGVALWQLYAAGQPDFFFPGWGDILTALVTEYTQGNLVTAFLNSIKTLFAGYLLAAVAGITIGLAMGVNERLAAFLNPYVNGLYVAPISALVPVIILVGGASFESRVFVVMLFAIFEIIVDTYEGAVTTPNSLLDVARSFGAGPLFVFRQVIFLYDLPYIFTGLRLGIGRAVKGMILAELLIEFTNLGAIIRTSQTKFDIAGVLAIVLLLMVLGIVLTQLLRFIGTSLSPWQVEVEI